PSASSTEAIVPHGNTMAPGAGFHASSLGPCWRGVSALATALLLPWSSHSGPLANGGPRPHAEASTLDLSSNLVSASIPGARRRTRLAVDVSAKRRQVSRTKDGEILCGANDCRACLRTAVRVEAGARDCNRMRLCPDAGLIGREPGEREAGAALA